MPELSPLDFQRPEADSSRRSESFSADLHLWVLWNSERWDALV